MRLRFDWQIAPLRPINAIYTRFEKSWEIFGHAYPGKLDLFLSRDFLFRLGELEVEPRWEALSDRMIRLIWNQNLVKQFRQKKTNSAVFQIKMN